MTEIEKAEFDEVTHRVLRNFLRSIGWTPYRYLVFPTATSAAPEITVNDVVQRCRLLAKEAGTHADRKTSAEPLLRLAMELEQMNASPQELASALPPSLVNDNAIACLTLARALLRHGRRDDAMALMFQGVAIDPSVGALRRELGLALRREGRFEEAAVHLDASIELRSGLRFDHRVPPDFPILVLRPSDLIEIHFYRGNFYVYRRDEYSVRMLLLGGELIEIRRNAAYCFLRIFARAPILRPLFKWAITRTLFGARGKAAKPAQGGASTPDEAATAPRIRLKLNFNWRAPVKAVALHLFARPLVHSGSIAEAMAIARKLAAEKPQAAGSPRLDVAAIP